MRLGKHGDPCTRLIQLSLFADRVGAEVLVWTHTLRGGRRLSVIDVDSKSILILRDIVYVKPMIEDCLVSESLVLKKVGETGRG